MPLPSPPPPHAVIVGGGLAGLAAAAGLVDRGLTITLLESRPRLGGRASSFRDPATSELVDNCQHVSMACCTNLADFCRRTGIDSLFHRDSELVFLGPDGRVSRFRSGIAPAPFHLAGSFLRARFLTLEDKLRVAYGLACLMRAPDERPGESCASWLLRHRQSARVLELFWGTVLVSALNERLDQMDPAHARKVFLEGFLRNRTGFLPELPRVPLGELYGARLEAWLRDRSVLVHLTTGVRSLELDDEGAMRGVVLRSGERIAADFVVLAVPFDRVRGLVPEKIWQRLPALGQIDQLRAAPITGVHLWFARAVCPFAHVVTPGRLIQWVFNHTAIQGRAAARELPGSGGAADGAGVRISTSSEEGQYLQVVISASYDLVALDARTVRDAVLKDLAEIWPAARTTDLLRWRVVTEHSATFSVRPGVEALRPSQRTSVDGLFLAGDWTDTGWPATMEGAVRSGYLAAQGILQDLDRPSRLLQPALRPGMLARWLCGASEIRPAAIGAPAMASPARFEAPQSGHSVANPASIARAAQRLEADRAPHHAPSAPE
jgi:squalene-associated FAD-dependent desaturase